MRDCSRAPSKWRTNQKSEKRAGCSAPVPSRQCPAVTTTSPATQNAVHTVRRRALKKRPIFSWISLYLTGTGERSSLPKTAIGKACGLRSGIANCQVRAGVAAVAASTAATIAVLAPTPRDLPAVITPVILTPVVLTPVILAPVILAPVILTPVILT